MLLTDKVTITLEFQEWNNVLGALGEAPFRIVAPIVRKVSEQLQTAIGQGEAAQAQLGNGADYHAPN